MKNISKYLFLVVFFFLINQTLFWAAPVTNSQSDKTAKQNEKGETQIKTTKDTEVAKPFIKDPLIEESKLPLDEIYPREDLNIGPYYLTEIKNPLQFSIKPYLSMGLPVFPAFKMMEAAGMDLFSGQFYLAVGAHLGGIFGDSESLRLELFSSWFASSQGSGLSSISNGVLTGSTSLNILGFSVSEYFYLLDYLFLGLGGGITQHRFEVNYTKRDIFVNNQVIYLEDEKTNSLAPMILVSLGTDIPLYQSLRAQIGMEYQLHIFKEQFGAFFTFHAGVHLLF